MEQIIRLQEDFRRTIAFASKEVKKDVEIGFEREAQAKYSTKQKEDEGSKVFIYIYIEWNLINIYNIMQI